MVVAVGMRQYVIDELQRADHLKLKDYLNTQLHPSGLSGIYWIFLENEMLNDIQKAHHECCPFYLAVELTETAMHCELLVRAKNRLRCDCIAYADRRQRECVIGQMDTIVQTLAIQA